MGLLDDCLNHFNDENLYSVLGVEKSAKPKEIKKAYHKCSLKYHPDRVTDDKEDATRKFQTLGKVYSILSDKEKRAVYDETGDVSDDCDIEENKDWSAYWRLLFPKVNLKDIEDFEKTYKGSSEELEDIKAAYLQFDGDMEEMLENVMCCTYKDEPRFRKLLQESINNGELPDCDKFKENQQKSKKRRKKAMKEEKEAEEMMKSPGLGSNEASLMAMIQKRQSSRQQSADNFFAHLEEKYSKPNSKAGAKKKKKMKERTVL